MIILKNVGNFFWKSESSVQIIFNAVHTVSFLKLLKITVILVITPLFSEKLFMSSHFPS